MLKRITGIFGGRDNGKALKEIIGRSGPDFVRPQLALSSADDHRSDYAYWDELRWGNLPGFQLSGLYASRINRIFASWVMGDGFTVSLADVEDEYTDNLLARWSGRVSSMLLSSCENLYALGDQFIFVNPDRSLSIPSPETVQFEFDNFTNRVTKATIEIRNQDSTTVLYVYEPNRKTVTTKKGAVVQSVNVFSNPLGIVPVVLLGNDRDSQPGRHYRSLRLRA